MPRIICDPLSSLLTTFTAVLRHLMLNKSIKEIVYNCSQFQFIKTLPKYKKALRKDLFNEFDEPRSEEEDLGLDTS